MLRIVFIVGVISLALLAILARRWVSRPKKAEKREKAEILKQLLALSELENGSAVVSAAPARSARANQVRAVTTRAPARPGSTSRSEGAGQRPISSKPVLPRPKLADGQVDEEIRQRAYELYQKRGGANGSSTDDWRQAKEEVLSRKAKAGAGSS